MNLIDLVSKILAHDFGEVSTSPLIADMLSAYSKLYLNGTQPRLCGKCHKQYYEQLKLDGMKKAELYEKAKNRTCKPAWRGLKYINKLAKHFNNELLTDDQAVDMLNKGHLKEADFFVLPKGYNKPEKKVQEREENIIKNNPVKKTYPKKKTTKKKSK